MAIESSWIYPLNMVIFHGFFGERLPGRVIYGQLNAEKRCFLPVTALDLHSEAQANVMRGGPRTTRSSNR